MFIQTIANAENAIRKMPRYSYQFLPRAGRKRVTLKMAFVGESD